MAHVDPDTLVYESGGIKSLGQDLARDHNDFSEGIDEMFNIIDNVMNDPNHWSGPTFNDFKNKCDDFRAKDIHNMSSQIRSYVTHMDKTADAADETNAQVRNTVGENTIANTNITSTVNPYDDLGQIK